MDSYKSIEVHIQDVKILRNLELFLDEPIPIVSTINWSSFGVEIQNSRVVGLSLFDLGLSTFPEYITELKQLETLYIHGNKLKSIAEDIGKLTNLKTLYLHENQLRSLPNSFGDLSELRTLNLNTNRLISLDENLFKLTNLEMLVLDNNQLTTLPENLGEQKN